MNKEMMKFMNQQYIANKMQEIEFEKVRLAVEKSNEEIAQEARDAYTLELIEGGVIQ